MNGIVNFLGLFKTFVHAKGALNLRNFPLILGLLTKLAEPLREILQGRGISVKLGPHGI